jgi:hypothetical protein
MPDDGKTKDVRREEELKEIKFRIFGAPYKEPKRWYYFEIDPGSNFDEWIPEGELDLYTGLKDKNGKEIYEGDIVQFQNAYDDTTAVEIEYDPSEAYFTVPTRYSADMEIIGNIYENPELLEVK